MNLDVHICMITLLLPYPVDFNNRILLLTVLIKRKILTVYVSKSDKLNIYIDKKNNLTFSHDLQF